MNEVTNDKLVKVYLRMRERKAEMTREFEKAKAALEQKMSVVEGHLLKFLLDTKSNSSATDEGTFYREKVTHVRCTDWEAYHQWLLEQETLDGLEKRVGKTFVMDYMKDHNNELPPGIVTQEEYAVRVRVPSK